MNKHEKRYPLEKVAIIGAGDFAREILTCIKDILYSSKKIHDRIIFVEPDDGFTERNIHDFKVIPQSLFDPSVWSAVVSVSNPEKREKIVGHLPHNTHFATVVHPSAVISEWVNIKDGSVVTAGSILTCDITVGMHSQLNLHTTIGHDTICGDYFTTAPAANISGACKIGNRVYFGTNSSIRQGVTVCDDVTVGMGSVVIKDISEPGIYVGSPSQKLVKHN
ncbi:NeuD/PglB/VioB family sugar acetyltransferase [Leptospira gomenensis]|uniref:NeuD/PglB/VioB family sugar acetyltransferase n=1 Tax=Leptospira gomenensis TaxID=2484974 RepID=UPI001438346D|nr:NeuD/PglB/VioB family sugar acetyltransferase [Leptospira gomenensis]